MGPGGAGAVRGRAEPSPQDSNPNSWEIGARNEGPRAGGWCPLLRSGKAPAPPRLAGILSGRVDRAAGADVPAELLKFGSTVKKKEDKNYGAFGPRADLAGKKATKIVFD